MNKNLIKLLIAVALTVSIVGSSFTTEAYPAFLRKASKFGAKNCLFCHKNPEGGEGWNERGNWLIAEKQRRKAEDIDIEWLSEYKEGEKKDEEKKEDKKEDKKEGENREKKEKP